MEKQREVEEIWRWMRGSKIKKKKVMLSNKETVVKEKSEKYKSDFKTWDQDEKMKHHHYLQKGIKKKSSSGPLPLWGQNRYLISAFGEGVVAAPLCPWQPQPGSHCSASLPAGHSQAQPGTARLSQAQGWAQSSSVLPKHSSWTLPTASRVSSSPLLMHCLPLFHLFNLKVHCDWDKGRYLCVDCVLKHYQVSAS